MQVIGTRVGAKSPRGKIIASKAKQNTNAKERWENGNCPRVIGLDYQGFFSLSRTHLWKT